jgi:hypothetical protein
MWRRIRRMLFLGIGTLAAVGALSLTTTPAPLGAMSCNNQALDYPVGCARFIGWCCDASEPCACPCDPNCECGGICEVSKD